MCDNNLRISKNGTTVCRNRTGAFVVRLKQHNYLLISISIKATLSFTVEPFMSADYSSIVGEGVGQLAVSFDSAPSFCEQSAQA